MLRNSDAMPFKAVLDAAPHAEHMHIRLELDIGLNQDRTWLLNVTHFNVSLYNVDEWVFQESVFHLTFADGTGFSHRLLHHIPIAGVYLEKKWSKIDQSRKNWRAKFDWMLVGGLINGGLVNGGNPTNRSRATRLVLVQIKLLQCDDFDGEDLKSGDFDRLRRDCIPLATSPSTYINVVD